MIIARSLWRKAIVTAVAARLALPHDAGGLPAPGARLAYHATAYCKGITTTAGVPVQAGIAASDPELLPVGSVIELDSRLSKYNGIYTVMDTGPAVQGRQVDIYMWSCNEALQFGRQAVHVTVLRLGWNPRATTPGFMARLFTRPEQAPLPSRPLPQVVHDK
jgi:3D (Asp-Asp-Asp) domain-containing protein